MVRHIVLIRFRADVAEQEIENLFGELHRIKGEFEGLVELSSGRSESPENIERGYMHGFVIDFRGWDALQAYQEHPLHKAFGGRAVELAEGGLDGVLVFDLPLR